MRAHIFSLCTVAVSTPAIPEAFLWLVMAACMVCCAAAHSCVFLYAPFPLAVLSQSNRSIITVYIRIHQLGGDDSWRAKMLQGVYISNEAFILRGNLKCITDYEELRPIQ